MGWGDFGSNGSVHWRVGYEGTSPSNTADHADSDNQVEHPGNPDNKRPGIGAAGGKNHSGSFRITARFESAAAAAAALSTARVVGRTIQLDVPVRDFNAVRQNPGNPNDWEVRVDW